VEAKNQGFTTLLTFGGAFSNHIAATACVGHEQGFKTIGVIRGEELKDKWHENPTLALAAKHGMQFHFVTREAYRSKDTPQFLQSLAERFGAFYHLPEGGTNALAIKGCEEILQGDDLNFDLIACSVGTGGTLTGLIKAAASKQRVLGFSALKGNFLQEDLRKFANAFPWELITDYHFGGYAKVTEELIAFINDFKKQTGIALDPIYTGKMVFGILDMTRQGKLKKNTSILAIHTGGLQGILGMNAVLKKKNLPLLNL